MHTLNPSNSKEYNFGKKRLKRFISVAFISVFLMFISACNPNLHQKKSVETQTTILFVCEHGAARSTIAAAYFNKLAKAQGLNYIAVFKGINPDSVLTLGTKRGLSKDSFDVNNWKPSLVTQNDINNAAQIVTFDCSLPTINPAMKPVIQWNGIPAISASYDIARDEIVAKTKALIAELVLKKLK
jgi:arsenate reductase (thioredoxin)